MPTDDNEDDTASTTSQFFSLFGGCSERIALSAALVTESAPSQQQHPADRKNTMTLASAASAISDFKFFDSWRRFSTTMAMMKTRTRVQTPALLCFSDELRRGVSSLMMMKRTSRGVRSR